MSELGTAPWEDYLTQHHDHFIKELVEFCRIPSISSLSENVDDVKKAAEWVAKRMKEAGIENVKIMATGGHPVVYGDWLHATGRPTILIYGHFDTQPVDPLDLWSHPPFDPAIRNDRLYARGVSDDKGNMLIPIIATEAMLKSMSRLPVNVKFMFEGQEEIGSPQLPHFVASQKKLLACDLVVSADGSQWSEDQGNVLIALKGLCDIQIDMKGAKTDLHSGVYGGTIQNPLHALAGLIASMRSPDGKILVDDFYDDVTPLSKEDRQRIAAIPYNEGEYKKELGVDDVFGEPGYTTRERGWARPTLEVNGMWGGFQGEGTKTVLPNEAHAKITCRLVANQDPEKVIKRLTNHVRNHAPKGVKTTVTPGHATALPYMMPADHPGNKAVDAVLTELYGKPPYYTRLGGSVPVCPLFLRELGAYTVSFGFGLEDENLHAPDEFLRLSSFERGQKGYCLLMQKLGHTSGLTGETS